MAIIIAEGIITTKAEAGDGVQVDVRCISDQYGVVSSILDVLSPFTAESFNLQVKMLARTMAAGSFGVDVAIEDILQKAPMA